MTEIGEQYVSRRAQVIILSLSVVTLIAGILLYKNADTKHTDNNIDTSAKDVNQHNDVNKDKLSALKKDSVPKKDLQTKLQTQRIHNVSTRQAQKCENSVHDYVMHCHTTLLGRVVECRQAKTAEQQRKLLLDLATLMVNEGAHYALTGEDASGCYIYPLKDIAIFKDAITNYFLKLNILILTNKLLNDKGIMDTASLYERKECMTTALQTLATDSQISLTIHTSMLSLVYNTVYVMQGTEQTILRNAVSMLSQLAYVPFDINRPHVRSDTQKENILHKLLLDGYTANLFMDTILFYKDCDLLSRQKKIKEYLGHITMVNLLTNESIVLQAIACVLEDSTNIEDAQQYVESLIARCKDIKQQDIYLYFKRMHDEYDDSPHRLLYKVATDCIGIILSIESTHVPVLVALLDDALELPFNNKTELVERASKLPRAQLSEADSVVVTTIKRVYKMSKELYKAYIEHYQLNIENLQDSTSVTEALKDAFTVAINDNDAHDTVAPLIRALQRGKMQEDDTYAHALTILQMLDTDYMFGNLYGINSEKDKLAATISTLMTQILFNGVERI